MTSPPLTSTPVTDEPASTGQPPEAFDTIAALDIGTNSFHLVVARPGPDGFEVVTREKEMVRLGETGSQMTTISAAAIDRSVAALARMRRVAESSGASSIRAVATSATREAQNAGDFIERARSEAGVDIEVISGVEEARLIYLGILQAVPVFERRALCIDIGGGSTELLIGRRSEVSVVRSLKLGAVRLTERFFPDGELTGRSIRECREHIRSMLTHFARESRREGFDEAIASSGTAESVARMIQHARAEADLHTYNCYAFSADEVHAITETICGARSTPQRTKIPGLEANRADIAPAGVLILDEVINTLGIESLTFSEGALREGVLLDTLQRRSSLSTSAFTLPSLHDVTARSVRQLQERCDEDPAHSNHVAGLATELFDHLEQILALDGDAKRYLSAAARLANVGLVVSHSRHHHHSYYVIRNSELAGLTDHEIELIAQIARYHRKSAPKQSHQAFTQLSDDDQRLVRSLAAVLRVAIGLDRSHEQRVIGLRTDTDDDRIRIDVRSASSTDIALELYAANERKGLLEEVCGRRIELLQAIA